MHQLADMSIQYATIRQVIVHSHNPAHVPRVTPTRSTQEFELTSGTVTHKCCLVKGKQQMHHTTATVV
jgi:hypothetical protein